MADTKPGDSNAKLHAYWTVGEGGVGKVRWGTPGDWERCHTHLTKYVGSEQAKRMCANYHHEMTGTWPGSDLNRVRSGKPPRGKLVGPG